MKSNLRLEKIKAQQEIAELLFFYLERSA